MLRHCEGGDFPPEAISLHCLGLLRRSLPFTPRNDGVDVE